MSAAPLITSVSALTLWRRSTIVHPARGAALIHHVNLVRTMVIERVSMCVREFH